MDKKLVLDYLKATNQKLYGDSDELHNLQTTGDLVIVTEESACLNYREQHMIPILDIIAWVYSLNTGEQP